MKMKKTLAVALLAAVTAPSLAADFGFYAGVNLGQSRSGNPYPAVSQTKSSDTALGVLVGYQFNANWGVEGFYTDAGKFEGTYSSGGVATDGRMFGKTRILGIAAVGTLPVSDALSLYAKLGYAQAKSGVSWVDPTGSGTLDGTRNAASFGLGGAWKVTPTAAVRLGWDRYGAAAKDTNDGVNFFSMNYNVNVYSLGATFKF